MKKSMTIPVITNEEALAISMAVFVLGRGGNTTGGHSWLPELQNFIEEAKANEKSVEATFTKKGVLIYIDE